MREKNPLSILLSPRGQKKYGESNVKEFLESYTTDQIHLTAHDHDKLNAIRESIKEYVHTPDLTTALSSTGESIVFFETILKHREQEEVVIALLNTKNRIIHYETVFKGSLTSSVFHPRELARIILKHPTAQFMVAHNHPSGDPEPSDADIVSTGRLEEVGDLLGIALLDHIIVGNPNSLSMRESGFI